MAIMKRSESFKNGARWAMRTCIAHLNTEANRMGSHNAKAVVQLMASELGNIKSRMFSEPAPPPPTEQK